MKRARDLIWQLCLGGVLAMFVGVALALGTWPELVDPATERDPFASCATSDEACWDEAAAEVVAAEREEPGADQWAGPVVGGLVAAAGGVCLAVGVVAGSVALGSAASRR